MCTLTYLPFEDGSFILTTNRDESPLRQRALAPAIGNFGQRKVLYPVDGRAGGTWVAAADDRRTVCLLNGAFEPHVMGGKYRMSRGVMVLKSFEYPDAVGFAAGFDFEGVEPFTYVAISGERAFRKVQEYRWDGKQLYQKDFDPLVPAIWSSAQLYKPNVIAARKAWFRNWLLENRVYSLGKIQEFHHFGGAGDVYNDLRMNRGGRVQTVSTTAIENKAEEIGMHYADLLTGHETFAKLQLPKPTQ